MFESIFVENFNFFGSCFKIKVRSKIYVYSPSLIFKYGWRISFKFVGFLAKNIMEKREPMFTAN